MTCIGLLSSWRKGADYMLQIVSARKLPALVSIGLEKVFNAAIDKFKVPPR